MNTPNRIEKKKLKPSLEIGRRFKDFEKRMALKTLEQYSAEIDFVLAPYSRKSAEETMMVKEKKWFFDI